MRFFVAVLSVLAWKCAVAAPSCESLSSLSLPQTKITKAGSVAANGFDAKGTIKNLPAFCRVEATLSPSSDSDIKVEVWLPAPSAWNGKFMAVGNGGWAGSISYPSMAQALLLGYATSSTDTGHDTAGATFAFGHPEKLIDYGYRSEHEMTLKAKAVITEYYGKPAKLSYWNSCSSGGRQGLKEAQQFPEDFDGIIAGAPANNWTGRAALAMHIAQSVHKDEASYLPQTKHALIHEAVLQTCDALDSVKDGILEDPTRCQFDPKVLECKSADESACLTKPQVESARSIYAAVINPRTKAEIFPGLEPGSELGWSVMAGPQPFAIADGYFKSVVFKDANWNFQKLNFDSDIAMAEKLDNSTINATDPNLKPFFKHGGKLIQYHGWNDWQIAPLNSVRYYENVVRAVEDKNNLRDSYRLFMVPGMGHCGGGEGPNSFDMVTALETWVEKGKAPESIVATRYTGEKVERTRPLCPYPQVAVYKGTGSTDDAVNFVCKAK